MKVNYKNKKVNLPDFMIVGSAKSGTSSLFYYLNNHDKVFIPKIKEPWFFHLHCNQNINSHNRSNVISIEDDYFKLYENKKEMLLGDASTIYLYDYKKVIKNIKNFYGHNYSKIKILILLRNPFERAYSHYLNHLRDSIEFNTFEKCFQMSISSNIDFYKDYFSYGMYSEQVKSYLNNFDNVKIIISEEFKKSKVEKFNSILDFLNLDRQKINLSINRNKTGVVRNQLIYNFIQNENSYIKKTFKKIIPYDYGLKIKSKIINKIIYKPAVDAKIKKEIIDYFENDINNLQNIINKDLSFWKK